MTIAVVGSINMDVTAYMYRLPKPGETLHGKEYIVGLGGKDAEKARDFARTILTLAILAMVSAGTVVMASAHSGVLGV